MRRINLAGRKDIEADALRQRRDLYALAIGLLLFNLAGGSLGKSTSFGSLLPISLERPQILLWAAWAGFFYFWFRFWLISVARPFADYLFEVRLQAGTTVWIREIASTLAEPLHHQPVEQARQALLQRTGPIPKVSLTKAEIGLAKMKQYRKADGTWAYSTAGGDKLPVPASFMTRLKYWGAILSGYPKAILRERSFTDYTLPHLFAVATFVVGVSRAVAGAYVPDSIAKRPMQTVSHEAPRIISFACLADRVEPRGLPPGSSHAHLKVWGEER